MSSTLGRRTGRAVAAAAVIAAPLIAVTPAATASGTATATIAGTVFRDYNSDGIDNTTATAAAPAVDVGVAGGTVTAYDSAGTQVGTATSGPSGTYSLSVTGAASQSLRLEFAPPADFLTGPIGPAPTSSTQVTSGGPEQFVTAATVASSYNFGVEAPGDYCQSVPNVVISCLSGALAVPGSGNGGANYTVASTPALYSLPYTTSGNVSAQLQTGGTLAGDIKATLGQIGSTVGAATYTHAGRSFDLTAAFLRRDAALGPAGLGAVYVTDLGAAAPNASVLTTIAAGTDPRQAQSTNGQPVETIPASANYDWFHDPAAYPAVDRIGLGGMAMSGDGSTLYVVDLATKALEAVTIVAPASATALPTAGAVTTYPLPVSLPGAATGCAAADVQGFAVTTLPGTVDVGLTCVGPATADLRGYVYSFDPVAHTYAGAPTAELALDFGPRGCIYLGSCPSGGDANFVPWTDTFPSSSGGTVHEPQPLVSSLSFDTNGDLTIGVRDRFSDDGGLNTGSPVTTDTHTYETMGGGDLLRDCLVGAAYVLESNGSCGSRVGAAGNGPGNNAGPGGGEFYYQHYPNAHQHNAFGDAAQVPGFADIISTHYDPYPGQSVRTGGWDRESNTNGAIVGTGATTGSAIIYDSYNQNQTFSKASGLGDVALDCGSAPVQIGHRVWIDTNGNGVQDPGEPTASGVTVTLETSGGTVLATTRTDANGIYTFSSTTTAALTASTTYTVLVGTAADFAPGGALAGDYPTTPLAGTDVLANSKGTPTTAQPQWSSASVTTGAPGDDTSLNTDFGFTPLFGVGDFVWADANGNGLQDTGEPGINGATVQLLTSDGSTSAVDPSTGAPVPPTTTGASPSGTAGYYELGCVAPGTYRVRFTLPGGGSFTTQVATPVTTNSDADPATGLTGPVVLGPTALDPNLSPVGAGDTAQCSGGIDHTIDAGAAAASVSGVEYFDTNGNALRDAGEPGIGGLTVTLETSSGGPATDLTGATVAPATTGQDGSYSFTDLPGGAYEVVFTAPTGETFTTPTSGTSLAFTLPSGGSQPNVDAGVTAPGAVAGVAFVDTNGDGVQQPGEAGVGGVTVTLRTSGGALVGTATTASDGSYNFPDVAPGTGYTVSFSLPSGDVYTLPATGTSAPLGVVAQQTTTADQGLAAATYGIGDFVWQDTNGDGLQSPGEPGVPGVAVSLLGSNGQAVPGVAPVTTATDGAYFFGCVPAGTYTVAFSLPPGEQRTRALQGGSPTTDSDADPSTGQATVTVGPSDTSLTPAASGDPAACSGGVDRTIDAGYVQPASISGTLRSTTATGPGVGGVAVTLLDSTTGAPATQTTGAAIPPITTAADGSYSFASVPPGSYEVAFGPLPSGATFVTPPSGTTSSFPVAGGSAVTGQDAVVIPATYGIGDFVWLDINHNGVQDAGEPGLNGVAVDLFQADGTTPATTPSGSQVPTATTATGPGGGLGYYQLACVPAGSYVVRFTLPSGYSWTGQSSTGSTTATDSNVDPTGSAPLQLGPSDSALAPSASCSGGTDPTIDAGLSQRPATVAGVAATSAGAAVMGVTVTLEDATGTPVAGMPSVQTGVDGSYSFASVPPGTYEVAFVVPAGDTLTSPAAGHSASFSLAPAGSQVEDAVVTQPAGSITGTVTDQQGAPVPGVVVTLLTGAGTPVTSPSGSPITTTTGPTGAYSFSGLPPGTYEVSFGSLPPGETYAGSANSGPVVVTAGATSTANAATLAPSGTVSGVVRTPSGTPVPGVIVGLVGPTGAPVIGTNGAAVAPATTDIHGTYHFVDVPPGAYTVSFAPPLTDTVSTPKGGLAPVQVVAGGAAIVNATVVVPPATTTTAAPTSGTTTGSGAGAGLPQSVPAGLGRVGSRPGHQGQAAALLALIGLALLGLGLRRRQAVG